MSDAMREKIAEIISCETSARLVQDEIDILNGHDVADAIIAALPDMVPELVWDGELNQFECDSYRLFDFSSGYYVEYKFIGIEQELPTLEAAKAAANAHHRAALMAALGVKTE